MIEKQEVDAEQSALDYLSEFGNTRESDLLHHIQSQFKYSPRGSKKLVSRLENQQKIHRVVHSKLKPPAVYLSLKDYVPLEQQRMTLNYIIEFQKALFQYLGVLELSKSAKAHELAEQLRKILQPDKK
jgi:hypothetical protein